MDEKLIAEINQIIKDYPRFRVAISTLLKSWVILSELETAQKEVMKWTIESECYAGYYNKEEGD